jgi:hypothetical protein
MKIVSESKKVLEQLQKEIFKPRVVQAQSKYQELIQYYPPDISVHKLARQDPKLKDLKLRDVWLDTMLNREIALQERNKTIRVSVLLGRLKKEEGSGGKKKKRK